MLSYLHSLTAAVCVYVEALSGLSALYIQRRFGNDFVDISDVTMETVAVASGNDLEVLHVENCTCDVASNVAGIPVHRVVKPTKKTQNCFSFLYKLACYPQMQCTQASYASQSATCQKSKSYDLCILHRICR